MTPQKNESKQNFLNRCTKQKMADENIASDDAFTACNALWSDAENSRAEMTLSFPVALKEEQNNKRVFQIAAYTGQKVRTWWGDMVIDIAGMSAKKSIPVLREHIRDRVVGHSKKSWNEESGFYLSGDVSSSTKDGKEVSSLADEGFPWQASVGISAQRVEVLADENTIAMVNGVEMKGPLDIWRESLVHEVSFVALGADDNTAAIVLSDKGNKTDTIWEDTSRTLNDLEILSTIKNGGNEMVITLAMLEKDAPELLAQIKEAARAEVTIVNFNDQVTEVKNAAVTSERERILAIYTEAHGKETAEKFAAIVKPNASLADMLAFAADKAKAEMLVSMTKAAPESLGQGSGDNTEQAAPDTEEGWKAEYSKKESLQKEFGNVERYVSFKKAEAAGLAKVLKK
jgi:hypothetical protein